MNKPVLISFIGPSGSGKTTAANFAFETIEREKLLGIQLDVALPLRAIQTFAYETFGRPNPGDPFEPGKYMQDSKLLGMLAEHFQDYLGFNVRNRLRAFNEFYGTLGSEFVVVNADCRNNCYQTLKDLGFIFVRIENWTEERAGCSVRADRLVKRDGHDTGLYAPAVDRTDKIKENILINNSGNLSELKDKIDEVVTNILNKRHN